MRESAGGMPTWRSPIVKMCAGSTLVLWPEMVRELETEIGSNRLNAADA
jgi:hypothetical protein